MGKDLIDRQTLLAQMEAQEQGFKNGETDIVEPSWELAKMMIQDMDKEGLDDFCEDLLDAVRNGYTYPTQEFEDGIVAVVKDAINDLKKGDADVQKALE